MQAAAILETVLYARDLEAAERFYGELLGLELRRKLPGQALMFRCGNQMLLVFDPDVTEVQSLDADPPVPPHGARGSGHVCFSATRTEIDAWRTHLEKSGVDIESEFDWPQGGRSLYFRDPAGNSVEFAEPVIWGLE